MNILITGISSFIGCNVGRHLSGAGHNVYGTVRNRAKLSGQYKWLKKGFIHELGDLPDLVMFEGVDLLIHFVHDFRPGRSEVNIRGTQELCLAAKKGGVDRQIFVSSYSARQDAVSEYGKTKYALESFFSEENGIILRPGLVLGNGGLFKRMVRLVLNFPVLPLLDGGVRPVPIIDVDTLCQAISVIVKYELHESKEFNLFHHELVSLKYLLSQTRLVAERKTLFVNFPSKLLLVPLEFLQKMGIRIPISTDNVSGYIVNKDDMYPSQLGRILPDVPTVDLMISKAISQILEGSICQ